MQKLFVEREANRGAISHSIKGLQGLILSTETRLVCDYLNLLTKQSA